MSAIGAVGAVGATPAISPALLTFASPTQLDALARIAATPNVTAQQLALALGLDVSQIAGQVEVHLSQLRRLLLSAGFQIPAPTAVDASGAAVTGDSPGGQSVVPGATPGSGEAAAAPRGPGTAAVTPPPSPPSATHVPTPPVGRPIAPGAPIVPGAPVAPASPTDAATGAVGGTGGPTAAGPAAVGGAPAAAAAAGPSGATAAPGAATPVASPGPAAATVPPGGVATSGASATGAAGATAAPVVTGDPAPTGAVQGGGGPPVPAPAHTAYVQTSRLAAAPDAPLAPPALHAQGALRVGAGDAAVLVLVEDGAGATGGKGHGLAPALLTAGTPRGSVVVTSMSAVPGGATVATAGPATGSGAVVAPQPGGVGSVAPAATPASPTPAVGGATVPGGPPRTWSQVGGPGAPPPATPNPAASAAISPPPVPLQQVAADPIVGLRSWALVDLAVPPLQANDVEQAARLAAPTVPPVTLDGGSGPAGEVEAGDVLTRAAAGRPVDVVADARTAAAAVDLALRDPSKVRRLVLDLTGFFVGGATAAAVADDLLAAGVVRPTDPGRLAEMLAASGTWGAPKQERRSRKEAERGGGRKNLAEHLFAALFSMRVADQVEELDVPVTLIGPDQEAVRELLERAAQHLADATVISTSRPEVVVLEIIRGE